MDGRREEGHVSHRLPPGLLEGLPISLPSRWPAKGAAELEGEPRAEEKAAASPEQAEAVSGLGAP